MNDVLQMLGIRGLHGAVVTFVLGLAVLCFVGQLGSSTHASLKQSANVITGSVKK